MTLYAVTEGHGSRVVLVHGFTQTRDCWGAVGDDLTAGHEVVRVDAPGHGDSSGVQADLVAGAELLADAGGRAAYVGYSMGGRLCLHLAVAHPEVISRLVLISATGGIDDPEDRSQRRAGDEALARRLEAGGVDAFLDYWLGLPLFAGLPPDRSQRAARLENTAAGLASSLRLAGTGTQLPLWDRLRGLAIPTLVVAGALDAKYVALAERLVDTIGPAARLAIVEQAGHTAHLEQPGAVSALLREFLAG